MKTSFLSLIAGFICAAFLPVHLRAQVSANDQAIDDIAQRTAARAFKAHPHRVLVLTIQGCLLDPAICGSLDQKIRTEIPKAISGVQLLTRTDVLPLLPKHGLLPVDAYTSAVEPAAVDLGADLMVTESLSFIEGGYHVDATLTDLSKHTKLDEFYANLKEPNWVPNPEPLIFRQPADGPAVVIPRVGNSRWKKLFPSCEKCFQPPFTDEARAQKIEGIVLLVVTVTEQGLAQQIGVIRGLGGGLTDSAVQAVRNWRFAPALDPDGKPFATRTPIEVNFVFTR